MYAPDYLNYYDLETYLFKTVSPRFQKQGNLSAFDFFCIVIWKANRAKSRIAARLRKVDKDLEVAARKVTSSIAQQSNAKERLRYLFTYRFRLPIASAILTVLYPSEFTVYDMRVCDILDGSDKGKFHSLANRINFEDVWEGYQEFKQKVEELLPERTNLRDKDRYLWGKSFYEDLTKDIKKGFSKA